MCCERTCQSMLHDVVVVIWDAWPFNWNFRHPHSQRMPQSAPPRQTKCQQRVCRAIIALLQATNESVDVSVECMFDTFDMFESRKVLKDTTVEYDYWWEGRQSDKMYKKAGFKMIVNCGHIVNHEFAKTSGLWHRRWIQKQSCNLSCEPKCINMIQSTWFLNCCEHKANT